MNAPSRPSGSPTNDGDDPSGRTILTVGLLRRVDKRSVVLVLWLVLILAVLYGLVVGP
ncbi:hypothetical protein [Haloarchaeobius litoreus]|uniref:ABC transporter permease n=1 Tax=Haloarchaeobius litoreus TaxID=755306 RepID=A0ABD6DEB8_9EURY|nr:hypothetical protein [Haloarchaeobius litoreus]